MIVNKYSLLFLNNETKLIESDTVNASHMKEAIERCEAKHSFKIGVLSCQDSDLKEQAIPFLTSPATIIQLINLWNDRAARAVQVGNIALIIH